MTETIRLGNIEVAVTRKAVKHAHLSVHPPAGRVTLVAPLGTRPEVARAFAASKLVWIRAQQAKCVFRRMSVRGSGPCRYAVPIHVGT